ncbi:hypothetical protein CPJ18_13555 [Agrobacterium rosae]|uniref:Uncharacterized protein n=1 Tax=Agrobacterium rosae TaxID=1972867 RepID=A0AAE5VPG8_9HYPH|nr:hypothetical protein [Agrobacterium rosae]POO51517.1 hypothetical protein CPJ18_13555 [Agrobacterium rosae]
MDLPIQLGGNLCQIRSQCSQLLMRMPGFIIDVNVKGNMPDGNFAVFSGVGGSKKSGSKNPKSRRGYERVEIQP